MVTTRKCGTCGAVLPEGAPTGQCPECLLQLGLDAATDDGANSLGEPRLPLLRYFGDYELLEEIARGGMGVVYKARQVSLNRTVAVKMILAGHFAGNQSVARFRAEAEAAASLRHPNIVAIHEVGEHEGQQYFSMDYIEGRNLAQAVRDNPMSARHAAACIQTIAEAIQYAHERGVLHRDLKPSNVLLDAFDAPHITDFGLAKRLPTDHRTLITEHSKGSEASNQSSVISDQWSDLTLSGQVLGSPNYMPPEQASGKRGQVGPPSDVYSLGAILHHLLTGRAPFAAESVTDTLQQVLHNEPVSPRLLNPAVPVDLETICLKCLQKESARRYTTATELAEELGRFLRGEPILARPVGLAGKTWRWCQRKPALATLGGIAFVLFLVVAIGAPIAVLRTNRARAEAERARLEAEQNLYAADMRLASQAVHEGAFNHGRELLERHRPQRAAEDLRGFEWRYLAQAVQDSEPFRSLEGLPAPSGWEMTLLFRSERFLYNQSLGQLRAWDMTTWEPVPIVPPPQPASVQWQWDPARGSAYAADQAQHTLTVYTLPKFESGPTLRLPGSISVADNRFVVAMSHDRQTLAVGFQQGAYRVLVWDLAHDARIDELGNFEAAIINLAFSRDGTLMAASSTNGVVGLWDLKTLQPLSARPSTASYLQRLEFTPDNKRLLSYNDANLSVWDIDATKTLSLEHADQTNQESFGFSPDAKYLVVSWDGFELTLLDSRTLLTKGTMRGHRGLIAGIAFSPDGKLLASASVDQTARIWDMATQTELGIVGGFGERISGAEFSADGQSIVLIGGFGQIRVYQLSAVLRRGLFAKIPEQGGINRLALSPDKRCLGTISVGGTLALWDRQSRSLIRSVSFPRFKPESYPNLAFSPDGERVAWVTGDALRIMRVESGDISATAIDGNDEANAVAFSPDGRELAFGCGKQVLIYELVSGRQQRFTATDDEVFAIKYSPDGARIAFGDRQGTVTLCERAIGRVLSKVMAHPPHVYDLAMSPDGRLLATCGADATIKLWRVQPDGLHWHATLSGHMGYVCSVAFSTDGTRLVSACGDQTLKIWDPHRAAELATLYGHHHYATSVKFANDGRTIYSAGFDGEIHFWKAPPFAEIDLSTKSSPIQSRPARSNELK